MRKYLIIALGAFFLTRSVIAQKVYVDNVVIILDASGSMKGSLAGTKIKRMDSAKAAITEVINTIPQSTQIGLLVFGGNAHGWVYPLGARDDEKLVKAINGLSAGGGTPLGAYMKKGADRLLEERKAQYGYGSYRLLVVTDGEASDGQLIDRYTPDIISRGIITDVIGVDMKKDHALATKVHSYRRANDPASLKQAIQEVFAEVGKSDASQSGESVFAELEGFPDEMAMTVISALISSGNHPIGNVAKIVSTPAPVSVLPGSNTSSQVPVRVTKSRKGFPRWIVFVIIAGIVISILKKGRKR